jgi:hypothetical protein
MLYCNNTSTMDIEHLEWHCENLKTDEYIALWKLCRFDWWSEEVCKMAMFLGHFSLSDSWNSSQGHATVSIFITRHVLKLMDFAPSWWPKRVHIKQFWHKWHYVILREITAFGPWGPYLEITFTCLRTTNKAPRYVSTSSHEDFCRKHQSTNRGFRSMGSWCGVPPISVNRKAHVSIESWLKSCVDKAESDW